MSEDLDNSNKLFPRVPYITDSPDDGRFTLFDGFGDTKGMVLRYSFILRSEAQQKLEEIRGGLKDAYSYNAALFKLIRTRTTPIFKLTKAPQYDETMYDVKHNPEFDGFNFLLSRADMWEILLHNDPVMIVDPVIENIIDHTNPAIEKFRMPYNAFFINKIFRVNGGVIMGVFVHDLYETMLQVTKTHRAHTERRQLIKGKDLIKNITTLGYVFVRDDNTIIFSHQPVDLITNLRGDKLVGNTFDAYNKQVLGYAVNVANLLNLHADPANPRNPKRDLQIIPINLKKAQGVKLKKARNVYRIHVGGKIRQYAEGYNEALRRNGCLHAVQVRGHFRTFHSEWYTKMHGKTIWIPPFIRGADRELRQKIIEIIE